jgi:hypothetical protein
MPHLGELAALAYEGGKVAEYTTEIDQDASTPTLAYVGRAFPGSAKSAAVWQIRKLTFGADGDLGTTWADGNAAFDNIWDDRASLSYS